MGCAGTLRSKVRCGRPEHVTAPVRKLVRLIRVVVVNTVNAAGLSVDVENHLTNFELDFVADPAAPEKHQKKSEKHESRVSTTTAVTDPHARLFKSNPEHQTPPARESVSTAWGHLIN
jgi:protein required for attachment to host cells